MSTAPLISNGTNPVGNGTHTGSALALGVLRDSEPNEKRVSIAPGDVPRLVKNGYAVYVESGCGDDCGFFDSMYKENGAQIMSRTDCIGKSNILFSVNAPRKDFHQMRGKGCVSWVGRMLPAGKEIVEEANKHEVMLVDMTAVPRITIAQALDVLSSQAKVAGVRAWVEATNKYGRFHTAEMSAAGKYPPSQTFVLGCGVAGLAVMGAAKASGSVVRAWDVRDVSDQAASLGASWVKVDFKEEGAGQGGYAKESSAAFQQAQKETFHKHLKECDIVITTAAIPGRPSPRLIEDYMVKDMKPGSVIVDLAAVGGGNCALTKKDEAITVNGVHILGYTDLASRMATQASQMYSANVFNMLKHIGGNNKEAAANLLTNWRAEIGKGESGDIVPRSIACCWDGKLIQMPPPPQPTPAKKKEAAVVKEVKVMDPHMAAIRSALTMTIICALLVGMGDGVPTSLLATFVLAGAAGYQVVWGVAHALHTPLMSVTNAISGCTAIGGLMLLSKADGVIVWVLAVLSTGISFVNIVGGFIVTKRMLNLFKREGDVDYSYYALLPGVLLCALELVFHELTAAVSVIGALLCIIAIGCLAKMTSANTGCSLGMSGVAAAVVAILINSKALMLSLVLAAVGAGGGWFVGSKVEPMALPQTVAAFHSLVGAAAMLSSIGDSMNDPEFGFTMRNIFAMLGDFIGGITLTGSLVAFGKLNGNFFGMKVTSKPLDLPFKNILNLAGLAFFFSLIYVFCTTESSGAQSMYLWITAILASVMGVHLVGSVGGGDMPVCITVLNSYSGWALVAEGFMMKSTVLTIVGSLIGFSGGILTHIMCEAMNRDIFNVIFGGMNTVTPVKKDGEEAPKVHTETTGEAVAELLAEAKTVLIVPGYGMAAGRAQNAVADVYRKCKGMGKEVSFGIHPVAGRMPGQMNVLLAEASVPYDCVKEMDEVNPDMEDFDVCMVVGANDITNEAAKTVEGCAIYGMPVIEVWRAKKVIFCKRSMGGGYADLENPVFFKENTDMLLGNGKDTMDKIAAALANRGQV